MPSRWSCVRCGSDVTFAGECTKHGCTADPGDNLEMPGLIKIVEEMFPRETIRLAALAGPAETMEAAGLTNRGSLDWAMKHRGFPQPVKVLQRVRIWDLTEVRAWKDAQNDQ